MLDEWKVLDKKLPAYSNLVYPTHRIDKNDRTGRLYFNMKSKSQALDNCFFKLSVDLWNSTYLTIDLGQLTSSLRTKHKIKKFFFHEFEKNHDTIAYGKLSWRAFKFK